MTDERNDARNDERNDARLDELLRDAQATYRVPADAPYDAIWSRIERAHFDVPASSGTAVAHQRSPVVADGLAIDGVTRRFPRRRGWLATAAGIAATLVVGFGLGRVSSPAASADAIPPAAASGANGGDVGNGTAGTARPVANVNDPLQRATYEYLARVVTLLDSIPRSHEGRALRSDVRFVADATQMLGTTRLLLDSPLAQDPRMRDLLEDLELVLAQVARLRTAPRADELTFIAEAMDSRDVVPRVRTVAASYTASGF